MSPKPEALGVTLEPGVLGGWSGVWICGGQYDAGVGLEPESLGAGLEAGATGAGLVLEWVERFGLQ